MGEGGGRRSLSNSDPYRWIRLAELEILWHKAAGGVAEAAGLGGVAEQLQEGVGHGLGILAGNEQTGFAVVYDFGISADIGHNDAQTAGHRFEQGQRSRFADGGQRE